MESLLIDLLPRFLDDGDLPLLSSEEALCLDDPQAVVARNRFHAAPREDVEGGAPSPAELELAPVGCGAPCVQVEAENIVFPNLHILCVQIRILGLAPHGQCPRQLVQDPHRLLGQRSFHLVVQNGHGHHEQQVQR